MTVRLRILLLLAALSVSACGDDTGGRDAATAPPTTAAEPPRSPTAEPPRTPTAAGAPDTSARTGTPIRIRSGDTTVDGVLLANATARDLSARLPLTLSFRDHNGVEKTAPLPDDLSVEDAPAAHDPAAGDIGYWAPDGDLVLYYDDDAPAFDGIVRIGALDGDLEMIRRQPDGARVTIERAR